MRSPLTLPVEGDYSFDMSNVPKILCFRGLPASGKSTTANALVSMNPDTYIRINRDDFRESLYGRSGILESDKERFITSVQRQIAADALAEGKTVIVDDMNLRNRYLADWYKFAKDHGADFDTQEFPVTVEESIRRNENRRMRMERYVDAEVVRSIARRFLNKGQILPFVPPVSSNKPKFEKVAPRTDLPVAVIVDLDGTLADLNGRSPYDASERILDDLPRWAVICTSLVLGDKGQLIFMSGRKESARKSTETWLSRYFGSPTLFMRSDDDNRSDELVKYDLFNEHVRDKYDVWVVLDDRSRVVEMWREIGLDCFQVNYGDF